MPIDRRIELMLKYDHEDSSQHEIWLVKSLMGFPIECLRLTFEEAKQLIPSLATEMLDLEDKVKQLVALETREQRAILFMEFAANQSIHHHEL